MSYLEKENIDLIAEKNDEVVAVQLETGKSNTKKNINSLKQHSASTRIVIATNRKAELKAKDLAEKYSVKSKIKVFFIK